MNPLFSKPSNMRWVDLCIYIDNNFYTENRDENTCYTYMYLLAYMLASKAKYFNTEEDYDDFASELAWSTYQRMSNTEKKPVKSVLNYMKSIMYFRRNAYLRESFSEVIDPEYNTIWNSDLYKENCIAALENSNREIISSCVKDVFKGLPDMIKENIPKVYKSDKVLAHNLYISSLLSLLNLITLPLENEKYLAARCKEQLTFNDLNYYTKHQTTELILWHLPEELSSVVQLIINRVRHNLTDEIHDVSDEFKVSDELFDTLSNDILFGDNNEGSDYS